MINHIHSTVTSDEIISELIENSVKLTDKDKQLIIEKTYKAIVEAYEYESNGCDCGQPSCGICN